MQIAAQFKCNMADTLDGYGFPLKRITSECFFCRGFHADIAAVRRDRRRIPG